MSFTVQVGTKAILKAKAATRGMSLSAHIRAIIDELRAEHDLAVACAEIELRAGATVQ